MQRIVVRTKCVGRNIAHTETRGTGIWTDPCHVALFPILYKHANLMYKLTLTIWTNRNHIRPALRP